MGGIGSPTMRRVRRWFRRGVEDKLAAATGGRARLRVIVLLAGVLSLTSADQATVGALATELESALHVGNTAIGLLVTVSSAVGVLTTLSFGRLADRVNRVNLLTVSILFWCAAMVASGAAQSYLMLLLSRLALGAVVAAAGPVVASLTGDLFAAAERGKIYGFILAGELVGGGFGLLISGDLGAATSWRVSFLLLAVIGLGLAWAVHTLLPEPARGGQSQLPVGATRIPSADDVEQADGPRIDADDNRGHEPEATEDQPRSETALKREVQRAQVTPHEELVLDEDPTGRSLWWAVRYVLTIRTNLVLIVASSLGYFFFAGLRTFAIEFAKARYGLDRGLASIVLVLVGAGSLIGILISGRLSDALISRHHITVRPLVAGMSFLLAATLCIPGLLTASALIAVPLFFLAAAGVGGSNPPLDAARLDIMPSRLWGRAEAVRTMLRTALEASAPLLFGFLSTLLGGRGGGFGHPTGAQPHGGLGLDRSFLIMLVPLFAACALLLLVARRTYPGDVATAIASEQRIHDAAG